MTHPKANVGRPVEEESVSYVVEMRGEPEPASLQPLTDWMHENGIGCRWRWNDPFDRGMGQIHTGDHVAEANKFLAALSAARPSR